MTRTPHEHGQEFVFRRPPTRQLPPPKSIPIKECHHSPLCKSYAVHEELMGRSRKKVVIQRRSKVVPLIPGTDVKCRHKPTCPTPEYHRFDVYQKES